MEVTVLYKTDGYYSINHKEIIGIYTSKDKLLKDVKGIIKDEISYNKDNNLEIDSLDSHINFFLEYGQTQGLGGDFELMTEKFDTNVMV